MTDEQLGLARRLVACEQWSWVYGMTYVGLRHQRTATTELLTSLVQYKNVFPTNLSLCTEAWPDLADYATAAILLRVAMEANGPGAECMIRGKTPIHPVRWAVSLAYNHADLGTAAATALLAIWEPTDGS